LLLSFMTKDLIFGRTFTRAHHLGGGARRTQSKGWS